ncbi:MAG: AraC family transcriptional regulator [Alistipes sp.]|nr:AraC family transcriptional regulator [Alistipes sp.]
MIHYYDWMSDVDRMEGVATIPGEISLFSYSDVVKGKVNLKPLQSPHKMDFILMLFQFSGSIKFKVDMVDYKLSSPCNSIRIMPGQIVSIDEISDDFDAHILMMSTRFVESLAVFINGSVSLQPGVKFDIIERIEPSQLHEIEYFVKALQHIMRDDRNPYRIQVVQHIIMAIFYSSDKLRRINDTDSVSSSADHLSRKFFELVKANFRSERQLKFYADELCITPRYLSRAVKERTGSSAADWIERYVVLEARALLKSTNMTIQQISDYLNFPSQTFFGKYFKRRAGLSPKEYRRIG